MAESSTPAHLYFRPPTGGFWRWAERGRVLTWNDGATIAFHPEIAFVLDRLAPLGLPPFGAIALLLAACSESFKPLSLRDERFGKLVQELAPLPSRTLETTSRVVFGGLDQIRSLPNNLRTPLANKATLVEAVVQSSPHRRTVEHSKMIAACFRRGLGPETLGRDDGDEWSLQGLIDDLNSLKLGLADVSTESLAVRLKTGLDEVVEAPDLDVPFAERMRQLVAELLKDEEHAGLARAAQRLLAAVALPRPLSSPDDLSLGGVSDVSNRGALDRLLVSELMHDDLTLAVRVAMNEALYLRRETPPNKPPCRRALLLDVGVRMWGLPRLFGAAAGMALALQAGDDEVQTYRAAGTGVERLDLASRDGLIAHLAALEALPHPGAALPAFLKSAALEGGRLDAVVVTHPDALADRAFEQALTASGVDSLYVATVARDGDFKLWLWTGGNRRVVTQAKLPLDGLFGAKRAEKARKLVDSSLDPRLPIAVRTSPGPLLTNRHLLDGLYCRLSEGRTAIATRDGRILIWIDPHHGATQVATVGRWVHFLTVLGSRKLLAVVGSLGPLLLEAMLYDLEDGTTQFVPLDFQVTQRPFDRFFLYNGLLYATVGDRMQIVDPRTGKHLQSLTAPAGATRCGDRYYLGVRSRLNEPVPLFALTHDGQQASFVTVAPNCQFRMPIDVFDVVGSDGPWASNGARMVNVPALSRAGETLPPLPLSPAESDIVARSQDGRRMVYTLRHRHATRDLRGKLISHESVFQAAANEPAARLTMPPGLWVETSFHHCESRIVRRRFTAIGAVGSEIVLFGRTAWWAAPKSNLGLRTTPLDPASVPLKRGFLAVHRLPGVRYHLRKAEWRDGSRAFLDSRGMVHLCSSDATLPELSIVLSHDSPPAVWCSDNRRWGDPYFHPPGSAIEQNDDWLDLVRRFVERLR